MRLTEFNKSSQESIYQILKATDQAYRGSPMDQALYLHIYMCLAHSLPLTCSISASRICVKEALC